MDKHSYASSTKRVRDCWHKILNTRVGGDLREAVKSTMRRILDRETQLSDSKLARMLTGQIRIAISRRTVAKYRLAMGVRRRPDCMTNA